MLPLRYMRTLGITLPVSFLLLFSSAGPLPGLQKLPTTLSATGLYSDISTKTVAQSNMLYSPQYPLWSDGAKKQRWISIPPGRAINAQLPEDWVFPVGTRFWKEFSFGRRVETRYLEKVGKSNWLYAAYAWNEDESEAFLVPQSGLPNHVEIVPGIRHDIPGTDGCKTCHEGQGRDVVLGFNALQLSPDRDPNAPHAEPVTADMIDLSTLARRELLANFPSRLLTRPPAIEARSPRERAALGYLSGNCGGCHNTSDPLSSVGMFLKRSVSNSAATTAGELQSIIGHKSKYQIPDSTVDECYRVAPGHPEQSSLLFRMTTRNPFRQMPPLGSKIVDSAAVTLISQWIREDLKTNTTTTHLIHH